MNANVDKNAAAAAAAAAATAFESMSELHNNFVDDSTTSCAG